MQRHCKFRATLQGRQTKVRQQSGGHVFKIEGSRALVGQQAPADAARISGCRSFWTSGASWSARFFTIFRGWRWPYASPLYDETVLPIDGAWNHVRAT